MTRRLFKTNEDFAAFAPIRIDFHLQQVQELAREWQQVSPAPARAVIIRDCLLKIQNTFYQIKNLEGRK